MYKYLLIFCFIFLFSACDSKSLENAKAMCIKDNKNFYITKALNYRTGKYEPRVVCD
ncbi:hypothetical protein [Arcobacter ellisii]|uniref:Lipoprotein n=1 Tax=Arcobacter ellisii TaxID=913109 RepID=A0ABN5P4W3_9BACT|nr:hypothetical protein [Arcobacter ellisii]AXX94894.1 hypothetical protein AELL_1227 [Arcobacter ellisii]